MKTPIFVYGSFRPGLSDEYDIFDLFLDKVASGILTGSSIYLTDGRAVAVEDNHEDGIIGELYWIKQEHRSRVMENASEVVAPEVALVKRSVFNVETGEEVDAYVYMVDECMKGFYENEAERVPGGDFEQYQTDKLDAMLDSLDTEYAWDEDDFEDDDFADTRPMALTSTSSYTSKGYTPATKSSKSYTPSFRVERGNENSMYMWYIGYGSNMNEERFLKYMNAGRYGKDMFEVGDFESRRVLIPHGVYFARSGRWGSGGIAFLDVDAVEDEPWYARAYRVTAEQLWSLACQENGSRSMSMDWNNMTHQRFTELSKSGLYSRVVNMGQIDGEHVFTVTNSTSYKQQLQTAKHPVPHQYLALGMLNPPSAEYLNIINEGAEQVMGLEEALLSPFKSVTPPEGKPKKDSKALSVSVTKADKDHKPVTSLVPSQAH